MDLVSPTKFNLSSKNITLSNFSKYGNLDFFEKRNSLIPFLVNLISDLSKLKTVWFIIHSMT